jgi:hypothetical protein
MNPIDFDLTQSSYIYGVSNTPLFLVRKLQADPSIRAISEACTGQQIVDALRSLMTVDPANAVEAVRPYAYLVALWFKPEIEHLQEAAKLQTSVYGWYAYIAQALIESFSPVHTQEIEVPGQLLAPAVSFGSATPTSRIIIES